MGYRRPSQKLKSPTTETRWALGAQRQKCVPTISSSWRKWAPNISNENILFPV